jgi:ferrochelatase
MERNLQCVVLANLGAPDGEDGIPAYIRSLLSDPMVLPLPWPFRPLLAGFIAMRRAGVVASRYREIGGRSPLAPQTRAQAEAVKAAFGGRVQVRHAFRHSTPLIDETFADAAAAGIKRVVAVPLFPQWSLSTSGSAETEIRKAASRCGVEISITPSFPDSKGYMDAVVSLTLPILTPGTHLVICAHGLPMKTVRRGDPYVSEVERTAAAVVERLPEGIPHSLAYQSRVGRMEWTGPDVRDEVMRLARAGVEKLVVLPVSFACENLETLHELDLELGALARGCGIASFGRVPAPGTHPAFIADVARMAGEAAQRQGWEVAHGP